MLLSLSKLLRWFLGVGGRVLDAGVAGPVRRQRDGVLLRLSVARLRARPQRRLRPPQQLPQRGGVRATLRRLPEPRSVLNRYHKVHSRLYSGLRSH